MRRLLPIALLAPLSGSACVEPPEPIAPVPVLTVEPSCPEGGDNRDGLCRPVALEPEPPRAVAAAEDDMLHVAAGMFVMGCSAGEPDCEPRSQPKHEVWLDAFLIDRTEVTVADYRACVSGQGCEEPGQASEYCTWGATGRDDHPVNCVSWRQASSYCRAQGKQLPTEAQWEKAARGGDGRAFPWGNEPASCRYAVMVDAGAPGCDRDSSWPVGSKPEGRSPYGASDMAGNVWEWTRDWYDESYYARAPRDNPQGPASSTERAIRGGSWDDMLGAPAMRTTIRVGNAPDTQGRYLGFRCAKPAG